MKQPRNDLYQNSRSPSKASDDDDEDDDEDDQEFEDRRGQDSRQQAQKVIE